MALTFPPNPANGDIHSEKGRTWQYDATAGVWRADHIDITAFDTDDIPEGANNLYYTDARVQAVVANTSVDFSAISESIIPDTNEAYDLGTADKKFRDLYLSSNTLHLGDVKISADANSGLVVKDASNNQISIGASEFSSFNATEDIVAGQAVMSLGDNVNVEGPKGGPESSSGTIITAYAGSYQSTSRNLYHFDDGSDYAIVANWDRTGDNYAKLYLVATNDQTTVLIDSVNVHLNRSLDFSAVQVDDPTAPRGKSLIVFVYGYNATPQIMKISYDDLSTPTTMVVTSLHSFPYGGSEYWAKWVVNPVNNKPTLFRYYQYDANFVHVYELNSIEASGFTFNETTVDRNGASSSKTGLTDILPAGTFSGALPSGPVSIFMGSSEIFATIEWTASGYNYTAYPKTTAFSAAWSYHMYVTNIDSVNKTIDLLASDYPTTMQISYANDDIQMTRSFISIFDSNAFAESFASSHGSLFTNNPEAWWSDAVIYHPNTKLWYISCVGWTNAINTAESEIPFVVIASIDPDSGEVLSKSDPYIMRGSAAYPSYKDAYGLVRLSNDSSLVSMHYDYYVGINWDGGDFVFTISAKTPNFANFVGIAQENATAGSQVKVAVDGQISSIHTGLTPNKNILLTKDGVLSTTSEAKDAIVGYSLSETEIRVNRAYGDSYLRRSDSGDLFVAPSPYIPSGYISAGGVLAKSANTTVGAISESTLQLALKGAGNYFGRIQSHDGQVDTTPPSYVPGGHGYRTNFIYGNGTSNQYSRIGNEFNKAPIWRYGQGPTYGDFFTADDSGISDQIRGVISLPNGTVLLARSAHNSTTLTIEARNFQGYGSGFGTLLGSSTITMPVSLTAFDSYYSNNGGFDMVWDVSQSRLMIALCQPTGVVTFLLMCSINFATYEATLVDTNQINNVSGQIRAGRSMIYVADKNCTVFATASSQTSSILYLYKVTSDGTTITTNLSSVSASVNTFVPMLHWASDRQEVIVTCTGINIPSVRGFYYGLDGSAPNLVASFSTGLPSGYNGVYATAYVPKVPGKVIIIAKPSSGSFAAIMSPTATSSDTIVFYSTNNIGSAKMLYNPGGGNYASLYASDMWYDETADRLYTYGCGLYSAGNFKQWQVAVVDDGATKAPGAKNIAIHQSLESIGGTINSGTFNTSNVTYQSGIIVRGREGYSPILFSFVGQASSTTGPYRSTAVSFYGPYTNGDYVKISKFVGYAEYGTDTATDPTERIKFLGDKTLVAYSYIGYYGYKWQPGKQYYLLPGNIVSPDAAATGAVPFGKYISQDSILNMNNSSTTYPIFLLT